MVPGALFVGVGACGGRWWVWWVCYTMAVVWASVVLPTTGSGVVLPGQKGCGGGGVPVVSKVLCVVAALVAGVFAG
ncbi:hypothetical protein GCM10025785_10430 [Corynebacterium canis]